MDRMIVALVALVIGLAGGWFGSGLMDKTPGSQSEMAQSDDAVPAQDIYARVNGHLVTRSDLEMFSRQIGADFATAPPHIVAALVEYSIAAQLLSDQAEQEGYADKPEVANALKASRRDTLYNAYVADLSQKVANDEAIDQAIAEGKFGLTAPLETHARHILVADEETAKDIIKQLNDGADFAELAKEHSTGPSGADGGDLGWFTADQMVEPFSKAAFEIEPGQVGAEPVQTQFGWHVIKVEERRTNTDTIRQQMANALMEEAIEGKITALREAADVEIVNDEVRALIEARDAPVEESPAEEAPADGAMMEEAPADDAAAEEAPASEAVTEEAPAPAPAAEEAPAEDAPEETPAAE